MTADVVRSTINLSVNAATSLVDAQAVVSLANTRINVSGNDYSTPLSNGATYYNNIKISSVISD